MAKSLLLALTFCLTVGVAARQAPAAGGGRLAGLVSDPVGVYVPGARIVIEGKRLKRELRSGDDGTYSGDLRPGVYRVSVAHPGFATVSKRVRITRDAVTRLDVPFRLDPGYSATVYQARPAAASSR